VAEYGIVYQGGGVVGEAVGNKFNYAADVQAVFDAGYYRLLHGLVLLCVKFNKWYCQLMAVVVGAHCRAAALVAALHVLHVEEVAAHVPHATPEGELLGVVAQQPVERVDAFAKRAAVLGAAHPLLAAKAEEPGFAHYALAVSYPHKKFVNLPCKLGTQPLRKAHRYPVVCAPCTVLIISTSIAYYNQFRGSSHI